MQLATSELRLEEIAPNVLEMASNARVIVFGTTICRRCDWTVKAFNDKGITAVKISTEDKYDSVLVQTRLYLGLGAEDLVPLPVVFIDGVFAWNDLDPGKIEARIKQFQEEAAEAAA